MGLRSARRAVPGGMKTAAPARGGSKVCTQGLQDAPNTGHLGDTGKVQGGVLALRQCRV